MLLRLKIILFICVFSNLSFAINDDLFNKIKDLIDKIKGGFTNFDKLICTPSLMIKLSKLGNGNLFVVPTILTII